MRATYCNIHLKPNSETLDNLFLLAALSSCAAFFATLIYINMRKIARTLAAAPKLPLFKREEVESTKREEKPREKIRFRKKDHQEKTEAQSTVFLDNAPSKTFVVQGKKKQSSDPSKVQPTLFSPHSALPTEIRFSDEFVYPSPPNAPYQVYPLPGQERSKPIAKIDGRLIYNTQYGVLCIENEKEFFESDAKTHAKCLKNGNAVYDSRLHKYKTHYTGPSGDARVYAENRIHTESGLILHLFDRIDRHAHPSK
jgi:hypothetical protein